MGKELSKDGQVIEFYFLANCPHCQKAFKLIKSFQESNPIYKNVKFELIEEEIDSQRANSKDYYYVPTFFYQGVKLHEGTVNESDIEKVLIAGIGE
jgi:glutaredoxin